MYGVNRGIYIHLAQLRKEQDKNLTNQYTTFSDTDDGTHHKIDRPEKDE